MPSRLFSSYKTAWYYSVNVWFALVKLHLHAVIKTMDDELSAFGKTLRDFKTKTLATHRHGW